MMTPKKRPKITILMQLNGQMEGLGKKLEKFVKIQVQIEIFQVELN